ncbi:MAG: HD domain-containing phosphohydrolase [Candidatus Omnitrophota bacterium]
MVARKRRYGTGKILLEVSRVVNSSMNPDEVSKLVLKELRKSTGSDHAALFLLDEKSGRFMLSAAEGFSEDEMDNLRLMGGWEVINDYMSKRKRPLIVDDIHKNAVFKFKNIPFMGEEFPMESFLAVPLKTREKVVGALMVSNRSRPGHKFTNKDRDLLLTLSNNIAVALLNARLYYKMKSLFVNTITSLTRAIDAKDSYTSGHSERVMKYTVAIGREMSLDEEMLENLRLASLLHDIGKIGIRESILMKPAKLLGYERRQMRMHPTIGARIIESMDDSDFIRRGILEHHERYDGKGYPNHLKGDQISLEGRIIAVADVFDALTTDRPYQKGYSKEGVFRKIQQEASAQFDPQVVAAFVTSYESQPEIWSK